MPGPRNKSKSKANAKRARNTCKEQTNTTPHQCLTLEEDEITRCGQPATEGYPQSDRCKVHHEQYRTLYKRYKDASKVVDKIKNGAELPTKKQIDCYKDSKAALDKARWVHKYLEALRVEKTGREIHQKRFFLKEDEGHRRRVKLLEREMVKVVDVLDALQGKAYQLYKLAGALDAMDVQTPSAELDVGGQLERTAEELSEFICNLEAFGDSPFRVLGKKVLTSTVSPEVGDEDLIDMSLRDEKEMLLTAFKPFIDFELFAAIYLDESNPLPEREHLKPLLETMFFVYQQFARRIIFHEPTLFMKSLDKVSFKDLVLSDDFSMEDLARFVGLLLRPLERQLPLSWFKDSVLDAFAISRHGTAANVGSLENRFSLLGGCVFNRAHTISMSNEAWGLLFEMLGPPGNPENHFVRLCNNYDDLIGFLSFAAFGFVPRPRRNCCIPPAHFDFDDPGLSRNHLSLSGIVVADMVSAYTPPDMRRPLPTRKRATRRGCIVWAKIEARAYMFGAMRNERDGFVEAFLRELRARPDLFQVVLRSDTAPGREVEMFGSGPSNGEALPAKRTYFFEAPPLLLPPSTGGRWEVIWSALDVLYGEKDFSLQGYLVQLARNENDWFFGFKKFPVTYFVILDTVPNRDTSMLARNVSWAALRAGGYAEGEYTLRKYAVASDKLFERCAQDRLGRLGPMNPKTWGITRMEDQVNASGVPESSRDNIGFRYPANIFHDVWYAT